MRVTRVNGWLHHVEVGQAPDTETYHLVRTRDRWTVSSVRTTHRGDFGTLAEAMRDFSRMDEDPYTVIRDVFDPDIRHDRQVWNEIEHFLSTVLTDDQLDLLLRHVDSAAEGQLARDFGHRDVHSVRVAVARVGALVAAGLDDTPQLRAFLGDADTPTVLPGDVAGAVHSEDLADFISRSVEGTGLVPRGGPQTSSEPALDWIDPRLEGFRVLFGGRPPVMFARILGVEVSPSSTMVPEEIREVEGPLIRVSIIRGQRIDRPVIVAEAPIADLDDAAPVELIRSALVHARSRLVRAMREHVGIRDVEAAWGGMVTFQGEHEGALDLPLAWSVAPALPNSVADDVRASLRVWAEAGIAPYVPERFAGTLESLQEWSWGSMPRLSLLGGDVPTGAWNPMAAYLLYPEVERFLQGDWHQRFHLCHAGHGINSFSINYVIVTDRLAVFAQAGWGGAYMDPDGSSAAVLDLAADLAQLVAFTDAVRNWPDRRLVVVHSDFRGSQPPAWVTRPGGEPVSDPAAAASGLRGALHVIHRVWLEDQGAYLAPPDGSGPSDPGPL